MVIVNLNSILCSFTEDMHAPNFIIKQRTWTLTLKNIICTISSEKKKERHKSKQTMALRLIFTGTGHGLGDKVGDKNAVS